MTNHIVSGQRFGRLVAVSFDSRGPRGRALWSFRCDCGTEATKRTDAVLSGQVQSCGCLQRESRKLVNTKHGQNPKGGPTPEYRCWQNMMTRCRNQNYEKRHSYGGRGISVCERWENFEAFFADMGQRPSPAHSIDRVDNDGNYEPGNCRWATLAEQTRNRRSNHIITFQGQQMCLKDACALAGQPYKTVWTRVKRGYSVEEALAATRYSLRDQARACRGAG